MYSGRSLENMRPLQSFEEKAAGVEGAKSFCFRFPLRRSPNERLFNLNDVLGIHLRELLRLLVPLSGGNEFTVDGYKTLNDRDSIQPLDPAKEEGASEPADPLDLYEPRIRYIQGLLETLLSIVELESNGESVTVDGFRLKNLEQWLSPCGGATDILAHAASRCNLQCRFCYNKGAPDILKPRPRDPEVEYREIHTRIKRYVPQGKLGVFPNMGSPCETLVHPHILDILRELRQRTDEPIRIPTNGSLLTSEMIQALSSSQPIFLDVSLNTASPTRRRWLMNDPKPQTALESLAGLKAMRVPYSVVIVPWPFPSTEIMLEDLEKTVDFAVGHDPCFIQISLPGYSRFFSQKEIFSQEHVWNEVKRAVQALRTKTSCPLILRPGLFEEYLEPDAVNDPRLIGVIKNSPGARAGMQRGDLLLKVGGLPVKNRIQARSLLNTLHQSDLKRSSLTVLRNGERVDLDLDLTDFDCPYDPRSTSHLGAIFPSAGIPLEWIERLGLLISSSKAKNVLILTSKLVRPVLEKRLREVVLFSGINLHLRIPPNRYLGGNIFMGDLMVVEDFIKAILAFLGEGKGRPDLAVIPSSPFHLSGWGRDLTGRVYLEIQRKTGIPVALVECDPIFD